MTICAIHKVDVATETRENSNKLLDTPAAAEVKETEFIYFLSARFMIQPRLIPVTCNAVTFSASPQPTSELSVARSELPGGTVKAPPINVG